MPMLSAVCISIGAIAGMVTSSFHGNGRTSGFLAAAAGTALSSPVRSSLSPAPILGQPFHLPGLSEAQNSQGRARMAVAAP